MTQIFKRNQPSAHSTTRFFYCFCCHHLACARYNGERKSFIQRIWRKWRFIFNTFGVGKRLTAVFQLHFPLSPSCFVDKTFFFIAFSYTGSFNLYIPFNRSKHFYGENRDQRRALRTYVLVSKKG